MCDINYMIDGKKVQLKYISTGTLLDILRHRIEDSVPEWRSQLTQGQEVPFDAIQRGPIYYAEDMLQWDLILDVFENRTIDIDAVYNELMLHSSVCAQN